MSKELTTDALRIAQRFVERVEGTNTGAWWRIVTALTDITQEPNAYVWSDEDYPHLPLPRKDVEITVTPKQ